MTQEQDSDGRLTKNSVVMWTLAIVGFLAITLGVALLYDQTPWDWLRILIVPAMIAIGGFLLNRSQREREIKITEQRAETDRQIADQRSGCGGAGLLRPDGATVSRRQSAHA